MNKLNPKWVYAAILNNEDGSRFGTCVSIKGNTLTVLSKGSEYTVNAKKMDKAGRLVKPHATHAKYL